MGILPNISTGAPLTTPLDHATELNSDEKGREGVRAVYHWLINHGFQPSIQRDRTSPFDILCAGKRVEVKICPRRPYDDGWFFNIHRHGVIRESEVDVYVLRLEGVPGFKNALHLLIPSPIGKSSVHISLRSLITRFGRYYNRFDFLGGRDLSGSKTLEPAAAIQKAAQQ